MPPRRPTGVLASEELLRRFERGEVFVDGSWAQANVRAAAYDLRIATDGLVLPERVEGKRHFPRTDHYRSRVLLLPGDVAFFSSTERLAMPWDLAGNIGIKFGFARRGLLVLTGLVVDPGFGQEFVNGAWVAKQDERLHFLVVNLGRDPFPVVPGRDVIASLQVLHLEGAATKIEVTSAEDMEHEFFDPSLPGPGLQFFTQMAGLEDRHERLAAEQQRLSENVQEVKQASEQIILFGSFLVATTLLGVVFVQVLSFLGSKDHTESVGRGLSTLGLDLPKAIVLAALVIAVGSLLNRMLHLAGELIVIGARKWAARQERSRWAADRS